MMDSVCEPKATIILLCYNQEATVSRALESVLAQKTRFNYEVLVADDCSTDSTRRICEEYARRYPDKIRMMPEAPNKGVVDNYFDALLAARGEYVGDCAGDDEWLSEDRLERQITALDENDDVSAVSSNAESFAVSTGETKILPGSLFVGDKDKRIVKAEGRRVLEATLDHDDALPYVLSSALYKKGPIVELLKHQPEIVRCKEGGVEDLPLIAALGSTGNLLHLPFTGYRYYIDGESISNNLSFEKEYNYLIRVIGMVIKLADHYGLERSRLDHFLKEKTLYLASLIRQSGSRDLEKKFRAQLKKWEYRLSFKAKLHLWLTKF